MSGKSSREYNDTRLLKVHGLILCNRIEEAERELTQLLSKADMNYRWWTIRKQDILQKRGMDRESISKWFIDNVEVPKNQLMKQQFLLHPVQGALRSKDVTTLKKILSKSKELRIEGRIFSRLEDVIEKLETGAAKPPRNSGHESPSEGENLKSCVCGSKKSSANGNSTPSSCGCSSSKKTKETRSTAPSGCGGCGSTKKTE